VAGLRGVFAGGEIERVKFKVVRVEGARTRQLVAVSGLVAGGVLEVNGEWGIGWEDGEISEVEVGEYEAVSKEGARLFVDATDGVLPRDAEVRRQYSHGTDYWRQRVEVYNRMFKFGYAGLAVGDADGDGLDDVYSCQNGGLPNRLWLQSRDGTLREATAGSGLGILDATRAALFLDLDNDGDQDVVATTPGALVFFENSGGGKFVARSRSRVSGNGYGLAAADYDGNGFLDIYVCRYHADQAEGAQLAVPVPYFNAENGGRNFLVRNRGPGDRSKGEWLRLDDATVGVGLDVGNTRFSFAAVWDDLDGDGDQDLYVANDFGRNVCYENRLVPDGEAKFVEVSMGAGLKDGGFGMSVSTGDFDRDGRRDLYVGNMYSGAGNRVTRQPKFRAGDSEAVKGEFRERADGNGIFLGRGDAGGGLRFENTSDVSGARMGRWSWGCVSADVNNDGWEDVLVGNGYVTGREADDL
ncbi:MAG: FG-GAP and VCBS repeat-containing protein, partial [Verrucomicrobiales bacterium]|nr:FG-GAP and VCBS repeat-containing protein [Verrucomicrobiales bacterium]